MLEEINLGFILAAILVTVILGLLSFNGFYYSFKTYEKNEDEEFSPIDVDAVAFPIFLSAILFVFTIILWVSKKIFPNKVNLSVVRITAFLIGSIFLVSIFVVWLAVLKS
jgi:membrane protease YdiL (CAAX protease family)